MKAWSDEQISAFLDGALEPAAAAEFEASLMTDAALNERLEAMRIANSAVKGAFDAPLAEPIPDRFRALIEAEPFQEEAAPAAPVVDLAARRAARSPRPFDWRIPLAASVALAVGWAGGMSVSPGRGGDEHTVLRADATAIDPANPLHRLLDETPSAETVVMAQGDAFVPVLSFAAADGRFCREFELASESAVAVGVACRGEETWRLEVLLAADDRPNQAQGYVQASGYNAAALDQVVAALGAGDPLGPEAEAAAMAAGWRAD